MPRFKLVRATGLIPLRIPRIRLVTHGLFLFYRPYSPKTELANESRKAKMLRLAIVLSLVISLNSALALTGATLSWTTYEAESMTINGGAILGPPPLAVDKNAEITNSVAGEASGRQ